MCYKPTLTVLATLNTVDFLYTCESHLTDPGFASRVGESGDGVGAGAKKMGLSPEEIAKVKADWEERQARKKEKEKEKVKEQEKDSEKDKTEDKEGKTTKGKESTTSSKASAPPTPAPSTPSPPAHERYALHRDIFALRLAEHRRRRQAAQAKELAPRLPQAPRAPIP